MQSAFILLDIKQIDYSTKSQKIGYRIRISRSASIQKTKKFFTPAAMGF